MRPQLAKLTWLAKSMQPIIHSLHLEISFKKAPQEKTLTIKSEFLIFFDKVIKWIE
jgi:hypothetical protein